MKTCNKCGIEKEFSEFTIDKKNRDGFGHSCKVCRNKHYAEWRKNNKKDIYARDKIWRENNKELRQEYNKRHQSENREHYREYHTQYARIKRKDDLNYYLTSLLRTRLGNCFRYKNCLKAYKTIDLIGCSIPDFKKHIESQFKDGMTWDNRGREGWEFDHIIPCSHYDLTDPDQQKECFFYMNIQPLWAKENRIKYNKFS